jgi:hypothetical protein
MVVVGYDDNRHGGAFEVLNSWGKKWGNAGYIWITYETFGQWVREAYEIIENLAVWSDVSRFSGFARIVTAAPGDGDGEEASLPVSYNREGYYTAAPLPAAAGYRVILGNTDPAYLYAFTLRASGVVSQVFPPDASKIIPVLDYHESSLTLPGEGAWIPGGDAPGDAPGDEYLILIYAKQEINLRQIRARLGKVRGTITERVSQSAGADFLPADSADYKSDEIRFTVESNNNQGIFALIVKIERR